jgi:hypothetical protein
MTKNEAKRNYLDRGILKKDAFDRFLNEDPTTQKKYVFYMIKEYLRQSDEAGNQVSDLSLNDLTTPPFLLLISSVSGKVSFFTPPLAIVFLP